VLDETLAINKTSAAIAVVTPIVVTTPTLLPAIDEMIMPAMPKTKITAHEMRIVRTAGEVISFRASYFLESGLYLILFGWSAEIPSSFLRHTS
jgi:hypothetical protein